MRFAGVEKRLVLKMGKGAMGIAHRSFFASKGVAFGDTFTKNHFFCLLKILIISKTP